MRKIAAFVNAQTGHKTRVYFNHEVDEFVVRLHDSQGVHYAPADYFTPDRSDALGTAQQMLREKLQ